MAERWHRWPVAVLTRGPPWMKVWEARGKKVRVEEAGFLHGLRRVGAGDTSPGNGSMAEPGLLHKVCGR